MITKELLLNQQVIFNNFPNPLTITNVSDFKSLKDIRITLENGKTIVLFLAFSNNFLKFVDENVQSQIENEVHFVNENHKQLKEEKAKIEAEAMIKAVERAKKIAKNKVAKKHSKIKNNPNIRKDRKNVAVKATYCDGNGTWFSGPCSLECRNRNCSRNGGRFCSTNSVCKKVIDGSATEQDILEAFNNTFLCYESKMLIDYKIYAGRDDDGTVRGWSLDNDRLVILTTVKPGESEEQRVIFGVFLINKSFDKDEDEAYATSYPSCRLSLTEEEAEQMKYWDYAPGEGANNLIQWKEGLLRYQSDLMCATVLKDMVEVISKRNDQTQTVRANAFLNLFLEKINVKIDDVPNKNGARIKN